jgi:predicted HD phosphohydrolase
MKGQPPFATVDELFDVLAAGVRGFDEEAVDLLAHGLQTAHLLAITAPEDAELQVAGLVHDVAHITHPPGLDHEVEGARLVEPLLGHRVASLIAGHVAAKRYLVATEPDYADCLSAGSVRSLTFQGGALAEDELATVEASPEREAILALRRADDHAKVAGARVAGLEHWRSLVQTVAGRAERGLLG